MKGKKQYLSILLVLAFVVALPASGVWGQDQDPNSEPADPNSTLSPEADLTASSAAPAVFFIDTTGPTNPNWELRAWWNGIGSDDHGIHIKNTTANRIPFRILDGAPTSSLYIDDAGEVGVGTSTPAYNLDVQGTTPSFRVGSRFYYNDSNGNMDVDGTTGQTLDVTSASGDAIYGYANSATGNWWGVMGRSSSPDGEGGYFYNVASSGTGTGLYGQSYSTSGRAIYGNASASTGGTTGVYGSSSSTSGAGVRGYATAASGLTYGVVGSSSSTTSGIGVLGGGVFGVWGIASPSTGTGVFGLNANSSGAGYGVQGVSYSSSGKGVYGGTTHASGTTYAVFGVANSTLGRGVYGNATATTGITYGVAGVNASSSGRGVFGYANNANGLTYGVAGRSDSPGGRGLSGYNAALTGNSAGIYGDVRSPNGWAGKFITPYGNGVYISTPAGKTGLNVLGGTKNAVVPTADGSRMLYSEESTEVWFTDYGFGQLQKGVAVVPIDPVFAQTVNLQQPYLVFLEEFGPDELYVSQRTPEYFEVRANKGKPNVEFCYRLVGKRLGHEEQRLASAPWADDDPNLYPEKRAEWEAMYALPEDMLEPVPPVELLEEPPVLAPSEESPEADVEKLMEVEEIPPEETP
jgi:hypothetical protein